MKIDLHAHILPQKWPDFEKVRYIEITVQITVYQHIIVSNSDMVVG